MSHEMSDEKLPESHGSEGHEVAAHTTKAKKS